MLSIFPIQASTVKRQTPSNRPISAVFSGLPSQKVKTAASA